MIGRENEEEVYLQEGEIKENNNKMMKRRKGGGRKG